MFEAVLLIGAVAVMAAAIVAVRRALRSEPGTTGAAAAKRADAGLAVEYALLEQRIAVLEAELADKSTQVELLVSERREMRQRMTADRGEIRRLRRLGGKSDSRYLPV